MALAFHSSAVWAHQVGPAGRSPPRSCPFARPATFTGILAPSRAEGSSWLRRTRGCRRPFGASSLLVTGLRPVAGQTARAWLIVGC